MTPTQAENLAVHAAQIWPRGETPAAWESRLTGLDYSTAARVFTEFDEHYQSSYDNAMVRMSARDTWRLTRDKPFLMGEFRWTGFDYIGECYGWPARSWSFGIIDLCGFPKDTYYFYQSQWTTTPMLHLLPHWTWPGKEGVTIPV